MWIRNGTVAVTQGSATVVGTGTTWTDAKESSEFILEGEIQRLEVLSISSDTEIELSQPIARATASGLEFQIMPTQGLELDIRRRLIEAITVFSAVRTDLAVGLFDLWLAEPGNESGTVAEFLLTLVGPEGASAYDTWLAEGNVGTEQDFLNAITNDVVAATAANLAATVTARGEAEGFRDQTLADAASTSADAASANSDRLLAEAARTDAEARALAAGAPLHPDTTAGLAATANGDVFLVPSNGTFIIYENQSGSAVEIDRTRPLKVATLANLIAEPSLVNGQFIDVETGANGQLETFRIDTGSSLTADGALVLQLAGVSGRAISLRTELSTWSELYDDVRSHADDTGLRVADLGTFRKLPASAPDFAFQRADGVKIGKSVDDHSPQHFGAGYDGTGDDTAAWQAYIDWAASEGIEAYNVRAKTRITGFLNCRGGIFVQGGSTGADAGRLITATSETRQTGGVLRSCRGARGVTFQPEISHVECLFGAEFQQKILDCRAIGYDVLVGLPDGAGQITLVHIEHCNLFNTRHAFLTDGLESGSAASVNEFHFVNNYCFGGASGVTDLDANPALYHRYGQDLQFDPQKAFIRVGVGRSFRFTGNTCERMHHLVHAARFDTAEIGGNKLEAVDIDYTWDAVPDSDSNRIDVTAEYAQGNNCHFRAFRDHRDPSTPGREAEKVILLSGISGTPRRNDIVSDGTNTAEVVYFDDQVSVIGVRNETGTLAGAVTFDVSVATATVHSQLPLSRVKFGLLTDQRTDYLQARRLVTDQLIARDQAITLYGADDTGTEAAHEVSTPSPWHALVLRSATQFASRIGLMMMGNNEGVSPINRWLSFEMFGNTSRPSFRIFRRNGGAVQEILHLNQNANLRPGADGVDLGHPVEPWQTLYLGQGVTFEPIAASGVSNDTLFLDSATSTLRWKDAAGVVQDLY